MVQYPNPFDRSFSEHHELTTLPPPPPPPPAPNPSSYFFPFSPPTFHNDNFHDLLLTPHHFPIPADAPPRAPSPTKQRPTGTMSSRGAGRPDRKRALRKDRHSKIFTAQGARDRRMRLSIEVARNFFDLQDTLGFDKASKTVQWLLTMSDSAIRDLSGTSRPKDHDFSLSSTSECENTSTVSDYKGKPSAEATETRTPKVKPKISRASRKAMLHPTLTRESRASARARARERTREKRINQLASSSISFETITDELGSHSLAPALELEDKKALDEIGYETSARAGLNHIFDYNHNFICHHGVDSLFQEQCGVNVVVVGNVEERVDILDDMQFHVRPWEILNNNSIL